MWSVLTVAPREGRWEWGMGGGVGGNMSTPNMDYQRQTYSSHPTGHALYIASDLQNMCFSSS